MKKCIALLCFGTVFGVFGKDVSTENSDKVEVIGLEQAVTSACSNNMDWKARQAEKNTADEQYLQSKFIFLPTLDATLTSVRSREKQKPALLSSDARKKTDTRMSLELKQNLFHSFRDYHNMGSKENSATAAFHKLKKAEQDLIVNVVKAYTEVWAERQKLQAHTKKEHNLRKLYESQRVCLSVGTATPADVAEAESKYQTAVYERVDAETRVVEAEAKFKHITGLKANQKMFIPDLNIKLPNNLDELEGIALRSNQEILQEKFASLSAEKELDAARSALGPSCDLKLEANRYLEKPENRSEKRSTNNYSAELTLTVPILNFPNYANIGVYSERAKQAEFVAKDKILEIKKNCKILWRAYKSAEASIKASRTAVRSAEISSESNLDQTNLGVKSNTEFLDAETSLLDARINLASSIKNKVDAAVQLFALTGKLDLRSMLDTLKKNSGVLDPMASRAARKKKSRKNLSRREQIRQIAKNKERAARKKRAVSLKRQRKIASKEGEAN